MKPLIFSLLIIAALPAAQGKRTFSGAITDSICAQADHSRMRMGATDGECAIACVSAHGSTYVLYDGHEAYALSNQEAAEKFAGRKVMVTGTLDARSGMIQVDSITAAR